MNIRKRYSEFDELRRQLIFTFPNFEAAVPALPRKSLFSKFSPVFLEKRRSGLQYFLKYVLCYTTFLCPLFLLKQSFYFSFLFFSSFSFGLVSFS